MYLVMNRSAMSLPYVRDSLEADFPVGDWRLASEFLSRNIKYMK